MKPIRAASRAASFVEFITDKKRDRKINKLTKQIDKEQEKLAGLKRKVAKSKLKLAGFNFDLIQLTLEEV